MQRAGWKISAEEDIRCMLMRLAFARSGDPGSIGQPNELRGITSAFPFNYHQALRGYHYGEDEEVVAEIQAVGSRVHIHDHNIGGVIPVFRPVDCEPQVWQGKITSLDDMAHFMPAGSEREIVVAEPEVEELLARILEKQQGAKIQRATEAMYEERKSGLLVPKVHAQIISLAEYKAA